MSYSIIVPVLNEEDNISIVIEKVKEIFEKVNHEIIVINNKSVDNTKEILNEISDIQIYDFSLYQSRSSAILFGLTKAKNEYIIIVDGDNEINLEYLINITNFPDMKDIYWCNRYIKSQKFSFSMMMNKLISLVVRSLYHVPIKDVMCGYLVVKREILKDMRLSSRRWNLNAEILSQLKPHYKVENINVLYTRRTKAEGKKINTADYFYTVASIFLIFFKSYFFQQTLIRLFDIILSLFALIIFFPAILFFGGWIFFEDFQNPIFLQKRIKKGGKKFNIIKLRSMKNNTGSIYTQRNDARITKVGKLIRQFKIDELPQLINILIGDMSVVGPRPDLEENIRLMSEEDRNIILSVRPGLADLASLKYFNEDLIEKDNNVLERIFLDKIEASKVYIFDISLKRYFQIIYLVLSRILKTRESS